MLSLAHEASATDTLMWIAAGCQHFGNPGAVKGAVRTDARLTPRLCLVKRTADVCPASRTLKSALCEHVQVVEPVWGSKEYIKYLVLVNTASGVSTFFVIYLAYAIDRNNEGNLLCVRHKPSHIAGLPAMRVCLSAVVTVPDSCTCTQVC